MPEPETRPVPSRLRRFAGATADFARRLYQKAAEDNIFFMAGAIAFNVLVAFIPLLLAILGIAGTIVRAQQADPTALLLGYLERSIPTAGEQFQQLVAGILDDILQRSTGLLSIGTLLLVWLSTRLIGTLRTALREIFDIQEDRGIVRGKLFDIKMVFAAGTLFAVNVGLTVTLEVLAHRGLGELGLTEAQLPGARFYGRILAFATIWMMFFLIYRYLPFRRIRWSTAAIAASITSVFFKLLEQAFSIFATNVDYRSAYGTIGTVVALVIWIYYVAVVFILGGEAAQLIAMQRIRRRQRERLG